MNLDPDHLIECSGFHETLLGHEGRLEGRGGILLSSALNFWLVLIESDTEENFDLPEKRSPMSVKMWAEEIVQSAAEKPNKDGVLHKQEIRVGIAERRVRLHWKGKDDLGEVIIEVWVEPEFQPAVSVSVRWQAPGQAATKFQDLPEWFCGLSTFAQVTHFSGSLAADAVLFACQHKGW